ncbi:MAG: 16S rRNA (uracil(1498)-N(3))-methyltransferase [Gemmatales bacterium]|nr:16S rRNA (uracil(1498)-N(3))-methyltransferase [Gemmatales bacterium]MDW8387702.1 RsmE family RNA methyltransferase [Gemmatales bacterium]
MSQRFYVNQPLDPGHFLLQGPEAHHLAVVSRIHVGETVVLFNGDGREWPARVLHIGKREVELDLEPPREVSRELGYQLIVACPLPKGDRGQFLIEKLTELGATAYVPLETRRSVITVSDAKTEKLQRYVIEASKQCGRNRLMEIREPRPWAEFVQDGALPSRRWLGHRLGESIRMERPTDTVLAVGPEGGFTEEELDAARSAGWTPISLGPRTLRIETAALALTVLAASSVS